MKKYSFFYILVFFVFYSLLSCGDEQTQLNPNNTDNDVTVTPASLSAIVSGTFNSLSSKDIAWGNFGVLYDVDNAETLRTFETWRNGSDEPGCNIYKVSSISAAGKVSATISGLIPETSYCFCIYFESEKGERRTTSVGRFTTSTFSGTIISNEPDNVRYYTSELSGTVQNIEKTDIENCIIGFRIAQNGQDLSKAEVSIANIDDHGKISLKVKGLSHSTDYIFQPIIVLGDNYDIVEGEISSFKTRNIDEMAVDLGLSVKWASCDLMAESPMEDGECYAWGEVVPNHRGTLDSYTYYRNGEYVYIGEDISKTEFDVVHMVLGGKWRMPTVAEVEEIFEKCSVGIEGDSNESMKIIFSKKGDVETRIVLKAFTKNYWNGKTSSVVTSRWTSNIIDVSDKYVYGLQPNPSYVTSQIAREVSMPIRPVCDYE